MFLILVCGCTPQKRLDRLVNKYPGLINSYTVTIKDTIIKKDTFILKQKIDSFVFNTDTVIDTKFFYIEKKNNSVKIITKQDTLYFTDTIFYEKNVPVPIVTNTDPNLKKLGVSFLILLIFFVVIRLSYKYISTIL